MGLEAIYPKPRLSTPAPGHRIYPYQLRGLRIDRPNMVWATDITYIRLRQGFIYLVAIMDWFSRYVLAWEVSTSMDSGFCVSALDWALTKAQPEIFNTDQGAQFTSDVFTSRLEDQGITISMDGRGRFLDNIFVERLWRTVKYEEVYLKDYLSVPEAISNLSLYFRFYNQERGHQVLKFTFSARQGPVADAAVEIRTRFSHENSLEDSAFSQSPQARRRAKYQPISVAAIHLKIRDFLSEEWGAPPLTARTTTPKLR